MPSINQNGIGPCVHKYVDGQCWFCGEREEEAEPDGDPMKRLVTKRLKALGAKLKAEKERTDRCDTQLF